MMMMMKKKIVMSIERRCNEGDCGEVVNEINDGGDCEDDEVQK